MAGGNNKLIGTIFWGFVFAVGLVWGIYRFQDLRFQEETRSWTPVNGTVLKSDLASFQPALHSAHQFKVTIYYLYQVADVLHKSNHTQIFDDGSEAGRVQIQYPSNATITVFVNPKDPYEASILILSRWNYLTFLPPLVLFGIGTLGLYATWTRKDLLAPPMPGEVSAKRTTANIGCLLFFFGLFIAGSITVYGAAIRPLWQVLAAKRWVGTPCMILSSEVKSSFRADDRMTYGVEILYSYEYKGREYKSNQYDFNVSTDTNYGNKAATVNHYRPGTKSICYVNPDDPAEAVIDRGYHLSLTFGLIGLPFMLLGGGAVFGLCRKWRQEGRNFTA